MTPKQERWADGLLKLRASETPAQLHSRFEEELGFINSHLCIADAALRDFADHSKNADFVRQRVRANGHRRLNVKVLRIASTLELSYTSHIALLLGRMDHLCTSVRSHPLVDRKLSEKAQGDCVRRALWTVLQSQLDEVIVTPLEDALLMRHIPEHLVVKFDRYRELRNVLLHAPASTSERETRFADVLACSKTLQGISNRLCRTLTGPHASIAKVLQTRFGNLAKARRHHAAVATMRQEYMMDDGDANGILSDLAW